MPPSPELETIEQSPAGQPEMLAPGLEAPSLDLEIRDAALIQELRDKNAGERHSSESGFRFANEDLARMAQENYTEERLEQIEKHLGEKKTTHIPTFAPAQEVMVGGTSRKITIVPATELDGTNHGDMSSMLYLRDQIQAASALMELNLQDNEHYAEEGETGRTLLISALHLMSTESQRKRFEHVIEVGDAATQEDWPHISLLLNDLEGEGPNGWRNKQDTLQMLAYATLDAIERKFLKLEDLDDAHKQFLASIVPLLKAVGYPSYENSGSWEELATKRTSVMAVETALLAKIQELSKRDDLAFLLEQTDRHTLDALVKSGLTEVGRRLPFESPDDEYKHDPSSVKYREADAALAYVLMYDLPGLLAESDIPIGEEGEHIDRYEIENLVLKKLYDLLDRDSDGMARYADDSYQRVNFHTNAVQFIVNGIKKLVKREAKKGHVDYERKQALRGQFTPQGKEAAWTHPLGQISAWAAERALQEEAADNPLQAAEYRELSTRFLNRQLSTVTGKNQVNAVLGADGYEVKPVAKDRLPEAYITYQDENGAFEVPSPHTPLNWSAATLRRAVGMLRLSTKRARATIES